MMYIYKDNIILSSKNVIYIYIYIYIGIFIETQNISVLNRACYFTDFFLALFHIFTYWFDSVYVEISFFFSFGHGDGDGDVGRSW
jgi:hypothetical protein